MEIFFYQIFPTFEGDYKRQVSCWETKEVLAGLPRGQHCCRGKLQLGWVRAVTPQWRGLHRLHGVVRARGLLSYPGGVSHTVTTAANSKRKLGQVWNTKFGYRATSVQWNERVGEWLP